MTTYAKLEILARQQEHAMADVAAAQAARDKISAGSGFFSRQLAAAERRLSRARSEEGKAKQAQQAALRTTIAAVDPAVPLLLLPIRLETRYDTGSTGTIRLRIRVFPDDLHRHAHEPALTADELAAGTAYWHKLWDSPGRPDRLAAWQALVTAVGPLRAGWVTRVLTPTNLLGGAQSPAFPSPPTQVGRWMHSAQAWLLPDRWVAHAWRGGVRIAQAEGDLIRRPLPCGPDPTDRSGAWVDPGMLWMTDFTEAIKVGMGLVMDLPDRDRIDLLTVVGVRGTETPSESGQALQELLASQQASAGLDLVRPGSPTNNTTHEPSAHGAPDPGGSALFVDPLQPPPAPVAGDGGDADLLARALGIPLTSLQDLAHAGQRDIDLERDMATVLWPGTWGYYLTQMLRLDEFDHHGPAWRRWTLERVRAGGPLPVLRVGDQPYGLLPVTSLRDWLPRQSSGLVVAELLRSGVRGPDPTRIAIRVLGGLGGLGGLNDRGGWTFEAPKSFVLPAPADASAVAIASADLDGDGLPEIVVACANATDTPLGGVRFAVMQFEHDQLVETGQMTLGTSLPFPKAPLSGLGLAVGPLHGAGAVESSAKCSAVVVLQYPLSRRGTQVLVHVGAGLGANGAVGAWADPLDASDQFSSREHVRGAALIPGRDGAVDLLVITAAAATTAGSSPLACRLARGLTVEGKVTGGWSKPMSVGTPAGAGIVLSGASVAIADLGRDGSLDGLLAQFWTHADGALSGSYTIGRDPADGSFGGSGDFYNLGQSAAVAMDTLVNAAATWLPWTPFRDPVPGLGNASRCVNLLERLGEHWRGALGGVARVRAGDSAPGRTLLDLLATDARSASYDARSFVGNSVLDNLRHLLDETAPSGQPHSRAAVELLLTQLGLPAGRTPLLGLGGFADTTVSIAEPLVAPDTELGEAPVKWLAEMTKATPSELHARWTGSGVPLLACLVRHSLLQAYADAAFALVPVPGADPSPLPEPELVDLADLTAADPVTPLHTLTSWRHLSESLYQGQPVAEVVYRAARAASPPPEVQPLADLLQSLDTLATVPSRDLDRLAAGVLDLATHRLDAWITAVATQRLDELRTNSSHGIQTGGYGFVVDLGPATSAGSTGYVHAPSMLHAATAAILRSGFLAHDGEQFAVDLSSTRVRGALAAMSAVRQGQSLGAVLGYRFERALYDRGLAHYLQAFRQIAPQDVGVITPAPADTDVQAAASLVTIDGLTLLRMAEDASLPWGSTPTGQTPQLPAIGSADHAALAAALDGMRDAADAMADIGIAESVHQTIQRNPIRAAGTLDALSRGELPPPESPDVLQTPRTGVGVTHRLLIAVPDPASAAAVGALAAWTATTGQRMRHVRAEAEPRLNAWAALVLGDPARVRFTVRYRHAATGALVGDPVDLTLDQIGLCPLDALAASSPGVASLAETNFGRRLLRHAVTLAASPSTTLVELVPDRSAAWATDVIGLAELLTVAESARNLVTGARAANRRDFVLGEAAPTGVEHAELGGRADSAVRTLTEAVAALRAFFVVETAAQRATLAELFPGVAASIGQIDNLLDMPLFCDVSAASAAIGLPQFAALENVRDTLELISAFGIRDAAPMPSTGHPEQDRSPLSVQSRAVAIAAAARLGTAAASGDDLSRLQAVFGDGFRALPLFNCGVPATTTAPPGADDAAVEEWFASVARVREPAARMQEALLGCEVAAGATSRWDIVQLPSAPAARWIALPSLPATPPVRIPAGVVSIAISTMALNWRERDSEPVAALAVDTWVEVVPSHEENTAVTFHLDAPGACAPQAALLAVHPDPARRWSIDILANLIAETSALAALRTIDPDLVPAVGHLLPALMLAHNVGGDPAGDTISTTAGP